MKDLVEIDVSTGRKNLALCLKYTNDFYLQQNDEKKKTVSVGRKFVCTSRIKYTEKHAFTIMKHGFHFKKHLKQKRLVSTNRNMVLL